MADLVIRLEDDVDLGLLDAVDGVAATLHHIGDRSRLGARLGRECHRDQDLRLLDLDVVDEAEVDDVHRDLGVEDLSGGAPPCRSGRWIVDVVGGRGHGAEGELSEDLFGERAAARSNRGRARTRRNRPIQHACKGEAGANPRQRILLRSGRSTARQAFTGPAGRRRDCRGDPDPRCAAPRPLERTEPLRRRSPRCRRRSGSVVRRVRVSSRDR